MYVAQKAKTAEKRTNVSGRPLKGIVDNRPESAAQAKLIQRIQDGSKVVQRKLTIGGAPCDLGTLKEKIASWTPEMMAYAEFLINDGTDCKYLTFEEFEREVKWGAPIYMKLGEINHMLSTNLTSGMIEETRKALWRARYCIRERDNVLEEIEFKIRDCLSEINNCHNELRACKEKIEKCGKKQEETLAILKKYKAKMLICRHNLIKEKVRCEYEKMIIQEQYASFDKQEIIIIKNRIKNIVDQLNQYWQDILVDKERVLSSGTLPLKQELLGTERRIRQSLIDILPKTVQYPKTKQCWFLSIFEGLRRSGLVYPIMTECEVNSPADWQEFLQNKFMADNHINEFTSRYNDRGVTMNVLKKFFGEILPYHDYSQIPMSIDDRKDCISHDGDEISFYTVEKPDHAMFYLGKNYTIAKGAQGNQYFKNKNGVIDISNVECVVNQAGIQTIYVYNQQLQGGMNQIYPVPGEINFAMKHVFKLRSLQLQPGEELKKGWVGAKKEGIKTVRKK